MVISTDYFNAVRAYRAARTRRQKHIARVALLRVALNGSGKPAMRAREILAGDGILVVPGMSVPSAKTAPRWVDRS